MRDELRTAIERALAASELPPEIQEGSYSRLSGMSTPS
jgi:hypothetical protein